MTDRDKAIDILSTTMTASIFNLEARCACGALQPDDVRWSMYEMEIEDKKTGEQSSTQIRLCRECEQRIDGHFQGEAGFLSVEEER